MSDSPCPAALFQRYSYSLSKITSNYIILIRKTFKRISYSVFYSYASKTMVVSYISAGFYYHYHYYFHYEAADDDYQFHYIFITFNILHFPHHYHYHYYTKYTSFILKMCLESLKRMLKHKKL